MKPIDISEVCHVQRLHIAYYYSTIHSPDGAAKCSPDMDHPVICNVPQPLTESIHFANDHIHVCKLIHHCCLLCELC